jgi:RNA polymerase sigma-70 factor (ECF subfamily)
METFHIQQAAGQPGSAALALAITADSDSEAWLNALRGTPSARDQAVDCLYAQLAAAARLEIARHGTDIEPVAGQGIDDLATHAADDALAAVLAELDGFRGSSRFTTWACKFAIFEAGRQARLHIWKHREVDLDSESWKRLAEPAGVGRNSEHGAVLRTLANGIATALTCHQRCVLVALTIDQVPIDVLADRLNTTRGGLYATLHDARGELRRVLTDEGCRSAGRHPVVHLGGMTD